jgi:hypothetical protein
MAVLFNGTTSKLEDTTATGFDVAQMTILVWARANSVGETAGRILIADELAGGQSGANGFGLFHSVGANTLQFQYVFNTTTGVWTWAATDGQWNAIALSYDRSATTNNPTVRINFASVTVTTGTTPSGTAVSPNSGYGIGNRNAADRTWDGPLAFHQFFNVLLTASEMDDGLRCPGFITRGLTHFWPLYGSDYVRDIITDRVPTGTSLSTASHPPNAAIIHPGLARYGSVPHAGRRLAMAR